MIRHVHENTIFIFHSYLIRNGESKNHKRVRVKSLLVTSGNFIFTMICAGVKQLKIQINLDSHWNRGLRTMRRSGSWLSPLAFGHRPPCRYPISLAPGKNSVVQQLSSQTLPSMAEVGEPSLITRWDLCTWEWSQYVQTPNASRWSNLGQDPRNGDSIRAWGGKGSPFYCLNLCLWKCGSSNASWS